MKYLKAQSVLPKEVIAIIQEFIDGEFVYIPRKEGKQRSWGEKSGAKDSLKERNCQIYNMLIDKLRTICYRRLKGETIWLAGNYEWS